MGKRKKKRIVSKNDVVKLLELQLAVMAHCHSLKAVTHFMEEEKWPAATARLDQAVTALMAVVRGQAVGVSMACPACGTEQEIVHWIDEKKCEHCGGDLLPPGEEA